MVIKKLIEKEHIEDGVIEIIGAREHNLKDIHLTLPRNKLIVITGISGSGKSSLAFDTLYAEGQRRYMESFSAYARSFIGNMERPDVDKINGLSPVIAIEQKTTSRNPRSTVGTTTEVYDFLRLLFARAGKAYSHVTGKLMIKQSESQILDQLYHHFQGERLTLLAPVVKGRKGHYRELFEQVRKMGYSKVRVNGIILDLTPKMQVDRYKTHDIEIVIDRMVIDEKDQKRVKDSIGTALKQGNGVMMTLAETEELSYFSKNLMDPETGLAYDEPAPNTFSFNSPYGACDQCKGLGVTEEITETAILPNPSLSISRGGILPLGMYRDIWIFKKIEAVLKKNKINITTPIKDIPRPILDILLYGESESIQVSSVKYPGTDWTTTFEGIMNFLNKQREEGSEKMRQWVRDFTDIKTCDTCQGFRLKKDSLHFKIADKHIGEISMMNINELDEWFKNVESKLDKRQNIIAKEILKEIRKRIGFMLNVGLDYLDLNRPLRTLSGGEAQRIRLATQIGTQLVSVLYILDEPSIGLHQRDNVKLIKALQELRDLGNTVIVVEHDKEMMLESDFIVDIGPGAGRFGGQIVAAAPPIEFLKKNTKTANYLNDKLRIEVPKIRRKDTGGQIILKGACGHNLKNVTLKLSLGKMICITGVSGSGKSSLIHETLYPILRKYFYKSRKEPLPYASIKGMDHLDKVIEVDQSPIGRTPRSNPATYTSVFTDIRALFCELPEAKIRGYKPGRFSFNVKGGRCETCQGGGMRVIEMDFLPDVLVACETCKGKRYNRETLEVRFRGKSIADMLDMTVEDAVTFFQSQPKILRKIEMLDQVGLGYITLGQHATTLSGGEAQRVKLATELSKKDTGKTLYILDEPTTGLHFQDIGHLLDVLNRLVDKGNTVLIVEHNMDIIKVADEVIDLGPEGGNKGGHILITGTPEALTKCKNSHTATYLKNELTLKRE